MGVEDSVPQPHHFGSSPFLRVHFINVGYGDAILLELPDDRFALIDAGDEDSSKDVLEYLFSMNVKQIEWGILTHPHKNHFGGFSALIKRIPMNYFFINGDPNGEEGYADFLALLDQEKIPISILKQGGKVENLPYAVNLQVLHPLELTGKVNDDSLVVWISFGDTEFLFTADIGKEIQKQLLQENPQLSKADCIQIPHHGDSVDESFVKIFQDKIFVISTGDNPWGLPDKSNFEKLKGKIYQTNVHGHIVVETDGKNIKVITR